MSGVNWLGVVALLMCAVLVAPGARRLGGGPWLGRAAVWLALLTGLVLLYEMFGPF